MAAHDDKLKDEIAEEQAHFAQVVTTFRQYRLYSLSANNRRRKDSYSLPAPHQRLLQSINWYEKLGDVDDAILANADFLEDIVSETEIFSGQRDTDEGSNTDQPGPSRSGHEQGQGHGHSHDHAHGLNHSHAHHAPPAHEHSHVHDPSHTNHDHSNNHRMKVSEADMDKLRSTLRQFVRDWSEEGREEREQCYGPMLEALGAHFADAPQDERANLRVLVPGAGLGRLTWEVVNLGFSCQGNEFSYFMLLSSFFILNRSERVNQYTVYPNVHSFSNFTTSQALLRSIKIPDVLPSERLGGGDFSQVAGDFEEVYGLLAKDQAGQWDAVLTCFFIDTAKNVISYLEIIHHLLAPGGVWINLGPLLWHFENNTTRDISIELNLEEVKELAAKMGFKLSNGRTIETTYVGNSESMLRHVYSVAFWTAEKT